MGHSSSGEVTAIVTLPNGKTPTIIGSRMLSLAGQTTALCKSGHEGYQLSLDRKDSDMGETFYFQRRLGLVAEVAH